AQKLAVLLGMLAARRQLLAPRLYRGKTLRLDHAATDKGEQNRRHDPDKKYVAPAVGADPAVDDRAKQRAKAAAGHHKAEDFGALGFGKGLSDKRDGDHHLGAGAEPGDKAEHAELPDVLSNALQRSENAVDQDRQRQCAHPAEVVGDDAEEEP